MDQPYAHGRGCNYGLTYDLIRRRFARWFVRACRAERPKTGCAPRRAWKLVSTVGAPVEGARRTGTGPTFKGPYSRVCCTHTYAVCAHAPTGGATRPSRALCKSLTRARAEARRLRRADRISAKISSLAPLRSYVYTGRVN